MAAKKKVKATRKKAPRAKAASRKKTSPVRKKALGRKPAAPRNNPAAQPAPEARPAKPPAGPSAPAAAPRAPAPLVGEERVGIVTHYFGDLSVAAVRMESGSLRLGDTIHIRGHTSDLRQRVDSIQVDHRPVSDAAAGQEIGLRVTQHVREHDVVYKIARPGS
jgi:hypothetical protein